MIPLVEHFFSIQGEGRYVGTPSIFFRFGGCNLRCPGFGTYEFEGEMVEGCDTIRAVDAARFRDRWRNVGSAAELTAIVAEYLEGLVYRPDVVITGGEPMLYRHDPIFYGFVAGLVRDGFRVTIETNATLAPDFDRYRAYGEVVFAMAVKLANSGEPMERRIVDSAIVQLATRGRDSFFKFTVDPANATAAEEIEAIREGYENDVYCMPLGCDEETLRRNAPGVVELCMKRGYIYSDRLHVRLWNREEGR